MDLMSELSQLKQEIFTDRAYLHQNPELSFQEHKTTAFLKEKLQAFGAVLEPLAMETGVSALIRGAHPGPTICIRNDMDALPIQEQTGLPFASKTEGVCHACGHDIHAIIALYCAKLLQERRDSLHGNVRIVIQPAEETGNGATAMMEAGLADLSPKTDLVIGTHVYPSVPAGSILVMKGAAQAASDPFRITVKGRGGHGAYPHLCVDPLVVSAYLITQLQTLVSREDMPTKPAVLTLGTISGGTAANIIPDEIVMTGTLRSLYPDARSHNKEAICRMTEYVCKSMRAEGQVEFLTGVPPVINDASVIDGVAAAADQLLGPGHVIWQEFPSMGSDDFSVFLEHSPGAQIMIGSANESPSTKIGLHRGENVFDPQSMLVGIGVLTQYILNALSNP